MKKYGDNGDKLPLFEIETPDLYKDMIKMKCHFDISKFDTTNPDYQPDLGANKAVVGKMKAESSGNAISELVGLRPNMYSFEWCAERLKVQWRGLESIGQMASSDPG